MLEALNFEQQKGEWALYEARIQLHRKDFPPRTNDVITVYGKLAMGRFYYHLVGATGPIEHSIPFCASIGDPLPPFQYTKPVVKDHPLYPDIEPEKKLREGYYPLTIARGIVRGPNHLHQQSDAIVCAVRAGAKWETRCFPRRSIPEVTWEYANIALARDRFAQLRLQEIDKSFSLKRNDVDRILLAFGIPMNDIDQLCKSTNIIIRASRSGRPNNAQYLLTEIRRGYLAWIYKQEKLPAKATWPSLRELMANIERTTKHKFFESESAQQIIETLHKEYVLELR